MNDLIQILLPKLQEVNIPIENCKIDVTTSKSGRQRGDIWVSLTKQEENDFEKKIIALIEVKHRNCNIGDMEWRDAMSQGKEKASKQGLKYYIVTNTKDVRYYNINDDEEIKVDGKNLIRFVSLEVLQKIQTQASVTNSNIIHKVKRIYPPVSEAEFRETLKLIANTYRSAGLKKGDERIDPTVSFVVLKFISEKEREKRTLNSIIELWDDLEDIASDEKEGDLKFKFEEMVNYIWNRTPYNDNIYKDFKELIYFPPKLKHNHFKSIYNHLNNYHFHGANFDLFGAIYEEFATQSKKKDFGEFYTRRHITSAVAKLLLRNEVYPRDMKICDPACGSGGFLTEAFNTLYNNYSSNGKLNDDVLKKLKEETIVGFDNDEKSVARTKINMFLVGDGNINIYENDSLIGWNKEKGWTENSFDYVLTNPPMGKYDGEADINKFHFTNESRYEQLFIEKVIKATKPGGEIAIVVNDGILETPTRSDLRLEILKHCNIYSIISLTKYAFAPYTKEKTYVMFMQKKQDNEIGEIQKHPIWHFILDYDGLANSDLRYRTKYHDDIPKLEEKFDGAVNLLKSFENNKELFKAEKKNFESEVNKREREEGLWGMKYAYVSIHDINESNNYNLISEYHLRPYQVKEINEEDFKEHLNILLEDMGKYFSEILD